MKILVVDDHDLFREGLVRMLQSQPDMQVIGEAGTVADAVAKARKLKPDLILLDYMLPDGTGFEASKTILANSPEVKIIFLTMHDEVEYLISAVHGGAKGYLLKDIPFSKLVVTLRGLEHDEAALSRKMTMKLINGFRNFSLDNDIEDYPIKDLKPDEVSILRELAEDATNKEIARHLNLPVTTVKNSIHQLLTKLKLKNRTQIALYARSHGLR